MVSAPVRAFVPLAARELVSGLVRAWGPELVSVPVRAQGLQQRHFGQALRLEVSAGCSETLSGFLLQQFNLPAAALYRHSSSKYELFRDAVLSLGQQRQNAKL